MFRASIPRVFLQHCRRSLPFLTRDLSAASSSSSSSTASGTNRLAKPFFTALLVAGGGLVAYGIYDYLTLWPTEVRGDLRAALRAKNAHDYEQSALLLRRAWETTKKLPLDRFRDRFLMITGVATSLGEVLELDARYDEAYEIYAEAWNILQESAASGLNGAERHRSVQLAYKLGTLSRACNKPPDEEERWLVFSVEEILKLVFDSQNDPKLHTNLKEPLPTDTSQLRSLGQVTLPPWISKTDVGAPLEALASFYREKGKIDYALPLYLQLISLMIPKGGVSTIPERCRGAEFMGHLAETVLLHSTSPESLHQAEAWSRKALSILKQAQRSPQKDSTCDAALIVTLMNLGTLREMSDDPLAARELFRRALERCTTDDQDIANQLQTSLDRLEKTKQ